MRISIVPRFSDLSKKPSHAVSFLGMLRLKPLTLPDTDHRRLPNLENSIHWRIDRKHDKYIFGILIPITLKNTSQFVGCDRAYLADQLVVPLWFGKELASRIQSLRTPRGNEALKKRYELFREDLSQDQAEYVGDTGENYWQDWSSDDISEQTMASHSAMGVLNNFFPRVTRMPRGYCQLSIIGL